MGTWPPLLPANASWAEVVALQLAPWASSGIDLNQLLRDSNRFRRPPAPGPEGAPTVALVDTAGWRVERLGSRWVAHHSSRAAAVLNLFRLTQRRAHAANRPLPRIRFALVVSDGHGTVDPRFNTSCTCKTEATCCDPKFSVAAARRRPSAPAFATLHCRHSWDVSVPAIIDDLIPDGATSSERHVNAAVSRWLSLGDSRPWEAREPRAFFVGDDKGYRARAIRIGRERPDLFESHRAVSSRAGALPFSLHARYRATVYAHGIHHNSERWRRLALLAGVVHAEESPCKEWWQLLARPWRDYAPTDERFTDLAQVAARVLAPEAEREARAMAAAQRRLALRAFRSDGLLDYLEELWRQYARLAQRGLDALQESEGGDGGAVRVTPATSHRHSSVMPASTRASGPARRANGGLGPSHAPRARTPAIPAAHRRTYRTQPTAPRMRPAEQVRMARLRDADVARSTAKSNLNLGGRARPAGL